MTVDLQINGLQILIQPLASKHNMIIRCANQTELVEWSQALNANIQASAGCKRDMCALSIKKQFWKFDRIS
jgi:hypothetical protein